MLGAITGDIIGSIYEWSNHKSKDFPLFSTACTFTDDSVLTIALADSILQNRPFDEMMREYFSRYPNAGYGPSFSRWARDQSSGPYDSWGNGSAMRISPAGYAYDSLDEVLEKAKYYASFTHNHPEGIKGAQATAACIYLARNNLAKKHIKEFITQRFRYDLGRTVDQIRPDYTFDVSCQGTVPEAIICFIESSDYEDSIRNAISIGGDSDTLACITGSIAEAFYGELPKGIGEMSLSYLDDSLAEIVKKFQAQYF